MHILFLSAWYPYPADNGSKLRIYNLLRGLSQQHVVTLVTFADEHVISRPQELDGLCSDIQVVPRRFYKPTSARALVGLLSPMPRSIVDTHVPLMVDCIQREMDRNHYDLVIASQLGTISYRNVCRQVPAILEEVEIGVFQAKKMHAPTLVHRLRHELPLLKLRFYLGRLLHQFEACTVVSDAERALLRRLVPGYSSIDVIPNCINLADYREVQEVPQPKTLVFTGSFRYRVNHKAMVWFLREVYPRVQARVPDVRLTITGDHANQPLPAANNLTLTGFVDDVRPLIASSWVSLAPIWLGGGTRLKILEAMALRTPVVSTSKGAEGLEVRHDEHLLIADTPKTFAEEVIRLLEEPRLRQRLVDNAHELVGEKYDWPVVMPRFLRLAEQVARTRDPRRLSSSQV